MDNDLKKIKKTTKQISKNVKNKVNKEKKTVVKKASKFLDKIEKKTR